MPFGILQWYIGATSWSTSTNALLLANVQEAEFVAGKYSTKSRQDTRQPRKVGVSMNTQISAAKGAVNGLSKTAMSPLLRYPFGKLCSGTSVKRFSKQDKRPANAFGRRNRCNQSRLLRKDHRRSQLVEIISQDLLGTYPSTPSSQLYMHCKWSVMQSCCARIYLWCVYFMTLCTRMYCVCSGYCAMACSGVL